MKNLHVIQTDKPSRLRIGNNGNFVLGLVQSATASKNDSYTNQNIYITSDEEIKQGDWCIITDIESVLCGQFEKHRGTHQRNDQWKKIILTTDQDLIKDNVQAIDDDFLEWFVKNPSCELVKINLQSSK
jgi:hypothetical protein